MSENYEKCHRCKKCDLTSVITCASGGGILGAIIGKIFGGRRYFSYSQKGTKKAQG